MEVVSLVAAVVALVGAAAAGGVVILLARRIEDLAECMAMQRDDRKIIIRRPNPQGLRIYQPEA